MKLATIRISGTPTWGIVEGDEFADIGAVLRDRRPDLRAAIAAASATGWSEVRKAVESARRYPLDAIEWLPVVPNPDKIICIGLNYESHRRETGRTEVANPTVFLRLPNSQIGHKANIIRPRVSDKLDYEGELAVIIGKGGRYIEQKNAFAHVAGYACYNEGTSRDWQRHTHQFTPGKTFPRTGAFGPWMVSADEILDVSKLHLTTRVNGEVVQDAGLDQLIFSIPRLIEYCSSFTQLEPGDVIATGTPGGVGFKREPALFLKPGDTVEVEIPGVGHLSNGIADEQQLPQQQSAAG